MTEDVRPPEAVMRIIRGIVRTALARCDETGITHAEFHRVMLEEQQERPNITLPELIERVFVRLIPLKGSTP